MSDNADFSLPEAARRLGVPIRVLRNAIRGGHIPAPPQLSATAALPAEWLASVEAAVEASPKIFSLARRQKVPAFARYEGTSVWRKYRHRVRAYNRFRAAQSQVTS